MNLSTEITFVSKHYAVMIFLAYLLEEKKVMDACLRYVIRMYDATYFMSRDAEISRRFLPELL